MSRYGVIFSPWSHLQSMESSSAMESSSFHEVIFSPRGPSLSPNSALKRFRPQTPTDGSRNGLPSFILPFDSEKRGRRAFGLWAGRLRPQEPWIGLSLQMPSLFAPRSCSSSLQRFYFFLACAEHFNCVFRVGPGPVLQAHSSFKNSFFWQWYIK